MLVGYGCCCCCTIAHPSLMHYIRASIGFKCSCNVFYGFMLCPVERLNVDLDRMHLISLSFELRLLILLTHKSGQNLRSWRKIQWRRKRRTRAAHVRQSKSLCIIDTTQTMNILWATMWNVSYACAAAVAFTVSHLSCSMHFISIQIFSMVCHWYLRYRCACHWCHSSRQLIWMVYEIVWNGKRRRRRAQKKLQCIAIHIHTIVHCTPHPVTQNSNDRELKTKC